MPLWLLGTAALLLAAAPAPAQVRSSANYTVVVDGIDSGGGTSSSANYIQRASVGQPFAAPPMVGTSYNNQSGIEAMVPAPSADTTPPSVPTGLAATAPSSVQINLGWTASTDNVAVTAYQVFRGGVQIATVNAPAMSFNDTGLAPATPYSYTVAACDAAGNCSAQSASASATTQAANMCVPDLPGMVARWSADGNTNDPIGGNNGTPSGGVSFAQGVSGQAFAFNGSSGYVQVPDSAGLRVTGTVSLSFWAKRQGFGIDIVLEKGGDWTLGQTNYGVGLNNVNNNMFYFFSAGGWWGVDGVSDLQWHHYAVVATDGAAAPMLYIDGTARGVQYQDGASTISLYPSSLPLNIGAQLGAFTYYSNNILDEVQIFNRALTASDVSTLHGGGTTCLSDTQAPGAPTGLTATAASSSQINLSWSAPTDNVAVTAYQVYRGGVLRATVTGSTSFSDTGLASSTLYAYTVAACDAAGNCSAQSDAASATTGAGSVTYAASLELGFNLISNSLNTTINVPATFGNAEAPVAGVSENVVSIWKWVIAEGVGRWAFHSPQLTGAANASYAVSRGYDVLTTINPGEGYWVNSVAPITLPAQIGTPFNWTPATFANLPAGFNLITHTNLRTPSEFNIDVNPTTPQVGEVPTGNFLSLWSWDAAAAKWYFYSPLLEASGGLQAVKDYADSHFYLHFQDVNKKIGLGVGFWVNRP